jgi:subtilisin-like proprotein convertase family protein
VSSTIVVPGDPAAVLEGDVSIALDIAHSWRGDLVVRLHHAGVSAVLHDREGGGQANLVTTLQTSAFAGTTRSGEWVLEVVDTAKVDTGRLVSWAITLPPTP